MSMPYSDCSSEPFSHAAIHLNFTCSLVIELLNGANKICSHIVLPHGGPKGCIPYSIKGFLRHGTDSADVGDTLHTGF